MSLDDIRNNRIKKLENIKTAGVNPYPNKGRRDFFVSEATEKFDELSASGRELYIVGRIRLIREHGGSTFVHIEDGSGKIQLYFKKDVLGEEQYKFFLDNYEVGDFIEAGGKLFLTKKGEKTLEVSVFRMLAKAINQLPEKWHGLQDLEERSRKRYLDLLMNPETKARFIKRSEIIKKLREFLDREGFVEVETPILQSIPGGALARPFKTHHNALDIDLYLRIAPELYLKRLLVGGFEKVYELGRCFRNEGIDATHNPDFTMLEFYLAYADYNDLMDLTEKLFKFLAPAGKIVYAGHEINLNTLWKRITMKDLILGELDIDIEKADQKEINQKLAELGVKPEDGKDARSVDALFKAIRPKIIEPTFVTDYPVEMSPLASGKEENPKLTERFQLIIGGLELVNAFSELNDPIEQDRRMKEQVKKHGDDVRYDADFIEALEYGMPPAAGWGMGVDRLVALLTDTRNLRDVILFPTMRQKSNS
ncbi:MAG: lysine--tRNA ligase [Candidatus Portnoybacteria bacterium]|nr:lysine--tRNA ligase [Candidatus Portnoybacteria bacterium]